MGEPIIYLSILLMITAGYACFLLYRIFKIQEDLAMYIADFRDSQDNLATVSAQKEETEDHLITAGKEYEILKEAYLNLFCIEPGCNNIKYHTFNYCTSHVDQQASTGTKNVSANKDEPKNMFVKND